MDMRFLILVLLLKFTPVFLQSQTDTVLTLDGKLETLPAFDPEIWDNIFQDRVGKKATPFSAKDFEGRPHTSDLYLGKVLLLYFWNIWDWDGCEKQTAALNDIARKYPYTVAVVSFVRENINLDEFAFLQEHPVHFTIIPNSYDFGMEYHGYKRGTPVAFFIDRQGYWQKIGWKAEDFEAWVEELLK